MYTEINISGKITQILLGVLIKVLKNTYMKYCMQLKSNENKKSCLKILQPFISFINFQLNKLYLFFS